MKITNVVINPGSVYGEATLSFRDPRRLNPFNVKNISGLDAEQIVPRFYGMSETANFYNMSLESRVVVVLIELNPDFSSSEYDKSYASLRDHLYKTIALNRTGKTTLMFKNGDVEVATLSGFVTKFESPQFEKTQQVQITLTCDDPTLKSPSRVEFETSFFGPTYMNLLDNTSTAPHGFIFDLTVTDSYPSLQLGNPAHVFGEPDEWSFEVTPVGGFLDGDIIHFSSEINNKYINVTRGSSLIQLGDVVTPGSFWPFAFPGGFVIGANIPLQYHIDAQHYLTYWGV